MPCASSSGTAGRRWKKRFAASCAKSSTNAREELLLRVLVRSRQYGGRLNERTCLLQAVGYARGEMQTGSRAQSHMQGGRSMTKRSTMVGLDVHKESIQVVTAEPGAEGEVRHFGKIGGDL